MKTTRIKRIKREEELPLSNDEIKASPEEIELNEFLENLGPEGVSEVRLYRVLANGKRVFVTSGPPTQFSELSVQMNHGAGDYIVRAILNGEWFRSKSFAVEAAPGTAPSSVVAAGSSELDRLKSELEAQRLRLEQDRQEEHAKMEADRQQREQRNHELQLKMLESFGNRGNDTSTIAAMIQGLRGLKDLSANDDKKVDPLAALNQSIEAFERLSALRGNSDGSGGNGDGGGGWQPVVMELARAVAPAIPVIVTAVTAAGKAPVSPTSPPAPASPALPPSATVQPVGELGQSAAVPPGNTTPPVNGGMASSTPPGGATPPAATAAPVVPVGASIPHPESPPATAAAQGVPTEDEYQAYKKGLIQYALTFALSNRDPELYGVMAFEQMGRGDLGIARLLEELNASKDFDSWFADLQKVEPMIISQRVWFSHFYKAVRDEITAQMEEERGA